MSELKSTIQELTTFIDALKGSAITSYELRPHSSITDFVMIVSTSNSIHCNAIVEHLIEKSKDLYKENPKEFFFPPEVCGSPDSGWVIVDTNSIIIHVIISELRDHYQLDDLFKKQ